MSEAYKDKALPPKQRAADLLKRMSLDEKMAQVNCLFPYGDNEEQLRADAKFGIGEVSCLAVREIDSLEAAAAWQRRIQRMVMENSEHHIPAIFHMEGLCGAFIQGTVSFPSGIARGASWDPALEEQVGRSVARQELACGISQVLAPVLDISRDSRMGRQGETYGEDPVVASAMGSAYVRGVQSDEIAGRKAESCAKHFLGFHNSQGGIHGANCDIPDRLLDEIYGKPFQAAITEAALRGIMPCYCSINGEPVSASHKILTKLLRGEMGFDGICASDYGAVGNVHYVQKVGNSVTEAGLRCMSAGMDVEMQNCTAFNEELKEWFADGRADMAVLDQAVLRVLEAKFRMGLFEHPFALEDQELNQVFFQAQDKEISLRSALESIVLLKNDGSLPIHPEVLKIALIGCHGNNARSFFGGYTHMSMVEAVYAVANSIAGMESGNVNEHGVQTVPGTQIQSDETEEFDRILRHQKPACKSLLEELKSRFAKADIRYAYGYPIAGDDVSHFEEALELVQNADLVIMTLGGKHGSCSVASMGEGVDSTDINLPYCQEEFIRRASVYGKPMVGVHMDGRPISSDAADTYLNAIIEAWNPSEMGAEAITQVLAGDYNPGGKLPVSVAYNAGQIPIYYNHPNGSAYHQGASIGFPNYVNTPHTPRYFFGHGLSYTEFTYRALTLSKKCFGPEEIIDICVTLENTGMRSGDEVVQLYVSDVFASMTRPWMELAGFMRVQLSPGAVKNVHFSMKASQLAFLDENMRWKVESGVIQILVGSSSEDIRLTDQIEILEDGYVEGKARGFYADVRIDE